MNLKNLTITDERVKLAFERRVFARNLDLIVVPRTLDARHGYAIEPGEKWISPPDWRATARTHLSAAFDSVF